MLIFLSFFTYHGDHRYLHSFPTRRSSDLELLLQLFREAILSESEPPRPLNARFQVRNGSLEAVSEEVFARTDRKSTRLNSSHLGISYAVFCLKKKTKNNKIERRMKNSV